MAVDSDSYGTIVKVEQLVGDLVPGRKFSVNTVPTTAQVEGFIDDIADEINALLDSNGYTVPVAVGTNPYAHGTLHLANSIGAAALVISMLPTESWTEPNQTPAGLTRRAFLERRYKHVLDLIESRKFPAARASTESMKTYAGSRTDRSTGETKAAIFKRSSTDYPGSRVLQE